MKKNSQNCCATDYMALKIQPKTNKDVTITRKEHCNTSLCFKRNTTKTNKTKQNSKQTNKQTNKRK